VIDYEILLLLDPELSEEQQGAVVARTRDLIVKSGGTIDRHDAWGRRKLAYEIDKKGEGNYHLLLFSCAAETLDEVSRVLKIDDAVLRHMATRRPAGGPVDAGLSQPPPPEPVAVTAPAREDVADDPVVASAPEEAAPEEAAAVRADELAAAPAEERE
jgi:small subunit ribosomal protein S6